MTGGNSGSGLNNSNSNVAGGGSNSGVNVTKAPSKGMSKAGNAVNQSIHSLHYIPTSLLLSYLYSIILNIIYCYNYKLILVLTPCNVGKGKGQPSGYVGGSKQIQVFFNGKIVTPQSLAPKKGTAAAVSKSFAYRSSLPTANEDDGTGGESKTKKVHEKPQFLHNYGKKEEEFTRVVLSETETQSLFFLPSLVTSTDAKDIADYEEKNKRYDELIESHNDPDGFMGRSTQTLNETTKNQNDMTASMTQKDSGCQATSFDIIDSNNQLRDKEAADADLLGNSNASYFEKAGLTANVMKFVANTTGVSLAAAGCLLDTSYVKPVDLNPVGKKGKFKSSKSSASNANIGVSTTGVSGNVNAAQISEAPSGTDAMAGGASASGLGKEASTGGTTRGEGGEAEVQDINIILREREAEKIMSSELLLQRILMLERAVQQNVYHRQHLDCRDLPDIEPLVLLSQDERTKNEGDTKKAGGFGFGAGGLGGGIGVGTGAPQMPGSPGSQNDGSQSQGENASQAFVIEDEPQKVKKLFSFFYAPLVQGRAVTAMAWNSVNTDILAVSYGRVDFNFDVNAHKLGTAVDEELSGGLVLFWSLRNPEYPEKILRTKQPVTSLDFSRFSPMLLAVGCYNGDVMVFDVKREGADWGKPKETSTSIPGGHVEPVWQIKWVSKGNDRLENVVSISTDGEVLQWDLKKGLSVQTLMSLKRGGLGDGWISRQAAGLTFDFVPGDSTTYFVGAEEGGVHKCSVSYNEQYLETYEGHEGPVYRLRCSNRWPNVFLSCSSDWNVKLFHVRNKKPVLTMRTNGSEEAVTDTVWCPGNATVFASVTESGRLHIWDLNVSSIDPVVNYDTSIDLDEPEPEKKEQELGEDGEPIDDDAADEFAAMQAARINFGAKQDDAASKESPVARLLRNLAASRQSANPDQKAHNPMGKKGEEKKKTRPLTTVLFSERSPTVVVGDVNGAVTLYRVIDPVTVLLEGPLQQVERLKSSILSQADPEDALKLTSYESGAAE